MDVCLISPPFQFSQGPSLALGLLKAALLRGGISCHVDYADQYMLYALGLERQQLLNSGGMMDCLGEYVFCQAAGIQPEFDPEILNRQLEQRGLQPGAPETEEFLRQAEQVALEQVDATARRVLAYGPKIVGVTSCFQQRNAAIAICRRIKQLQPEVVTLMGGANCFGRAGLAILRQFPWVDYVFFGESDDIFAPVCRAILEGRREPLPDGVLRQGDPLPQEAPHRIITDLDALPYPDFDEYFQLLQTEVGQYAREMGLKNRGGYEELALYLEASRGCWWGEKTPCTFCGLHGPIRQFRCKSPERAFRELCALTEKYGVRCVIFTDCILPRQWHQQFLPLLRSHNVSFRLFQEVRSHYSAQQIAELAQAGYLFLQPGIESLSDHVLKLMHKGVDLMQNLNFLKFSRKYRIFLSWNVLYGFPGETPEDYREQCSLFPLIAHFQPPTSHSWMIYARDNAYSLHPERYGLTLTTGGQYALSCPANQEYMDDVALYYDRKTPVPAWLPEAAEALRRSVAEWSAQGSVARLDVADLGDKLLIIDTRACRVVRAQYLVGAERDVYRLCQSPAWLSRVEQTLADRYDAASLSAAIRSLEAKRLLLRRGKSIFALAIPYTQQELRQREAMEFRYYLQCSKSLRQRLAEDAPQLAHSIDQLPPDVLTRWAKKLGMYFTPQDYSDVAGRARSQ